MEQTTPAPLSLPSARRFVPARIGLARRPARANTSLTMQQVAGFLVLHIPLLLVFQAVPLVATAHSVAVLLLGVHFLVRDDQPARVMWVMAYIAGCEILWRGVEATLVWEYGKYATLLLCILLLMKYPSLREGQGRLWLFIALLVPGVFFAHRFDRQAISFQLAGPVTMAMVSITFSKVAFRKGDLQRFFLAMIAPAVAMVFLIGFITSTQDVQFTGSENEEITGSIGANQVTAALSLGATAAFFSIFLYRDNLPLRNLMAGLLIVLTAGSVLTFSRSGLWNTAIALGVGAVFLVRDQRRAFQFIGVFLGLGVLGYLIIFPAINNLTGGTILERFSDFDSTGRDILFKIDYQLFLDNPVFGVGVGESPYYHIAAFGYLKPTHTEYGRLLAEHGSLGLAALVLLAWVTLSRIFLRAPAMSKAVSVGFTFWALFYLIHSATRMVAPSLAFGLATARFLPEESELRG